MKLRFRPRPRSWRNPRLIRPKRRKRTLLILRVKRVARARKKRRLRLRKRNRRIRRRSCLQSLATRVIVIKKLNLPRD